MTRRPLLMFVGLVALLGSARAEALQQGCLGTGKPLIIIDETFIGIANPQGAENQLRTALCLPGPEGRGLMFDYTGFEVGLYNYLSPIYDIQGVYVGVSPLSFLELRAGAAAVGLWPLPIDGAGYYGLGGYTLRFSDGDLPARSTKGATGANATLTAVLRGQVSIGAGASLLATDSFTGDYWYVPGASHYLNPRRDVVLAKSDWVVTNTATVLFEVRATASVNLHFGVVDDLTWVPASGYRANLVAAFVSVPIRRDGSPRDIEPFLRVGAYTHHAFRTGPQVFGGISIAWGKPPRGAEPALSGTVENLSLTPPVQ